MGKLKIVVLLEERTVERIDRLVRRGRYHSRSLAIEAAVADHFSRLNRGRLARECGKLDPAFEKALAEGMGRASDGLDEISGL